MMRVLISRVPGTIEIETDLAEAPAEFVQLPLPASGSSAGTIPGESAVLGWLTDRGGANTPDGREIHRKARAWFCSHRARANASVEDGQAAVLRLLPPGSDGDP
jgi:hypothetical protein